MSDATAKLAAQQVLDTRQFTHAPLAPSETLRRYEADLIASLARMAHEDGRHFVGWPKLTLEQEKHGFPGPPGFWLLRAEVTARR